MFNDRRRQFLDRPANHLAELEQPLAFFRPGVDLLRDPRPQGLVFRLEIFDIFASSLFVANAIIASSGWNIVVNAVSSYVVAWEGIAHSLYSATSPFRWRKMGWKRGFQKPGFATVKVGED